jgi:hypothetical protein
VLSFGQLKLAAASRSGTGRSASGWSSTGRRTRSRSCTGGSASDWSSAGRSAAIAAIAATWLAATNLGAAQLGAAQLGHLEAAALRAAGSWSTAARSGWRTAGRGRSSANRSASNRSGAGRSARGWSGTRGGWGAARWRRSATAAAMTVEQAGVGAVDAGETNQRGGNPCELHLTSPTHIGAVERERLTRNHPNTLSGGLDQSFDARLHHCPLFSDVATCAAQRNLFDLKSGVDCGTT